MDFNTISQKIEKNKSVDFGTIFSNSFDLYKKIWVQGFVSTLLSIIFTMICFAIIYTPFYIMLIANSLNNSLAYGFTPLIAIYYIFILVGYGFVFSISISILAHFYNECRGFDTDKQVDSDYFKLLKKPYIFKTIALSFTSFGISILGTMMCVIPLFYLMIPLSYFTVIYAFNPDLTIGEIVKLSFNLGNNKWGVTFGLLIVSSICAGIGYIACCVGILFTVSFVHIPLYFIYKEVIGFDNKDELDEIGFKY